MGVVRASSATRSPLASMSVPAKRHQIEPSVDAASVGASRAAADFVVAGLRGSGERAWNHSGRRDEGHQRQLVAGREPSHEPGARGVGICHSNDESGLARGVDVTRVVIRRSLLAVGDELDIDDVARR